MIDQEKIREATRLFLEGIGEAPERQGLLETPDRIARMCTEIFSGSDEKPEEYLTKTFDVDDNEMVIERDILFYSMCEHHLLPFFGNAYVAYIPDGKVVGISKLARVVDAFAKRPQIQERMCTQIADCLMDNLSAKGVLVVIKAKHMCMTMRGIKKPESNVVSYVCRGVFKEDSELLNRALNLINA